jgi:hypothetical protein
MSNPKTWTAKGGRLFGAATLFGERCFHTRRKTCWPRKNAKGAKLQTSGTGRPPGYAHRHPFVPFALFRGQSTRTLSPNSVNKRKIDRFIRSISLTFELSLFLVLIKTF